MWTPTEMWTEMWTPIEMEEKQGRTKRGHPPEGQNVDTHKWRNVKKCHPSKRNVEEKCGHPRKKGNVEETWTPTISEATRGPKLMGVQVFFSRHT